MSSDRALLTRLLRKAGAALLGASLCALAGPALALPLPSDHPASRDILARAERLIHEHPAATKVRLLAERPSAGQELDLVHVLPTSSRAVMTLAFSSQPDCAVLEAKIARVNAAIASLAELAAELLAQLERIARMQDEHTQFELDHAAELALAQQASAELSAVEWYIAQLELELAATSDPELIALYESELASAEAEAERIRSHPPYVAAWVVDQEAQALLLAVSEAQSRWRASHEQRLACAERELSAGQEDYEAWNAMEVATASTDLTLWDADVSALFALDGSSYGIRFIPATLENVMWRFEDASLPRAVPIEIILDAGEARAFAPRPLPLPGLVPLPGDRVLPLRNVLDARAIGAARVARMAEVLDENVRLRRPRPPVHPIPRVHAALSLGAYCGSLHTYDVIVRQDAHATLLAHRYELVRREQAPIETYTVVAHYDVQVEDARFLRCVPTRPIISFRRDRSEEVGLSDCDVRLPRPRPRFIQEAMSIAVEVH